MEFQMGSGGNGNNSGDEETSNASSQKERNPYHRHTAQQIQALEAFFKECPHPDENERRQLGRELGLDPKQIKFWFQNKRTQTKAQVERADNSALRAENERIHCENVAIREALKNVICPSCGGPPLGEEERQRNLQKLQLENAHLKEEHEKVSNLLAKYIGKPIEALMPAIGSSTADVQPPTFSVPNTFAVPDLDINLNSGTSDNTIGTQCPNKPLSEMEKEIMAQTVASARDELIRLVRVNEPFWVKSSDSERKYVIHHDSYEQIFPRVSHFKTPNARIESSKDSGIVSMNGLELVDMFLDADQWMNIFPTIVNEAKTIHVLKAGVPGNRNGCFLLMHQQMHILSPLVPMREFYFLRYCQQLELGLWVIVDVSYDWAKLENEDDPSISRAWKLPSGCMIQDLANGCSNVTWIEHVEVDDKIQTHRLYRDLICGSTTAYGAERWIVTLQRMCEKFAFVMMEPPPTHDLTGVITSAESRKSLMKLSHRMVKNFSGMLTMSGKLDFPQLSEVNNSGVRICVRKTSDSGQPNGIVVSAATSLWLPLPPETVFNFFREVKNRTKWDVLCNANPVHELARISNGANLGNSLSILRFSWEQPFIPTENNVVMIQENCIDRLGSMVIYAPIDVPSINQVISGGDSGGISILPSGIIISGDGRPDTTRAGGSSTISANPASSSGSSGSLLTVAFQILVSSPTSPGEMNMESVATVHSLISSTVQRIKDSLDCSNLD
ncbi:hypothetical protein ACOSQ3_026847 [Xanthoceras sorbifolium]